MSSLAGTALWAVVPFVPQPPFRIFAGADRPPFELADPAKVLDAARRGGDSEFSFIVRAKARPVLVLSEQSDERLGELVALRLLRLSSLGERERQAVQEHREPTLFHLSPKRFSKLPEENAAMIAALVRVHRDALDRRDILGRLTGDELRAVHERVIRHYRLHVGNLVLEEIHRLAGTQSSAGG